MSQTEWQVLQDLLGKLSRDEKQIVMDRLRADLNQASHPDTTAAAPMNDPLLAQKEKEALTRMIQKLEQMPDPNDGFSGRDHDEALYGWKK